MWIKVGAVHILLACFWLSWSWSVGFGCWPETQGPLQLVWARQATACMYVVTLSRPAEYSKQQSRTPTVPGLHVCLGELEQLAEGVRITAGFWRAEGCPPAGFRLRTVPPCTRRRLAQCTRAYHGLLWNAQLANDHDKHMCLCVLCRPRHRCRHRLLALYDGENCQPNWRHGEYLLRDENYHWTMEKMCWNR